MTTKSLHISFEELEKNLVALCERVIHERANIIVNKNTEQIVIRPLHRIHSRRTTRTNHATTANYQAFLSAAGSWKNFDAETFLAENAKQRQASQRPSVEL